MEDMEAAGVAVVVAGEAVDTADMAVTVRAKMVDFWTSNLLPTMFVTEKVPSNLLLFLGCILAEVVVDATFL